MSLKSNQLRSPWNTYFYQSYIYFCSSVIAQTQTHTHIRVRHTERGPWILISKRGPAFRGLLIFLPITCINTKPRPFPSEDHVLVSGLYRGRHALTYIIELLRTFRRGRSLNLHNDFSLCVCVFLWRFSYWLTLKTVFKTLFIAGAPIPLRHNTPVPPRGTTEAGCGKVFPLHLGKVL